MSGFLSVLFAAALFASQPLLLEVERVAETLTLRFELLAPLPESVETALTSGAEVRIQYPFRVYTRRRIWWDNRVLKGIAETTATFDAVTGRYLCQLRVKKETILSHEFDSREDARRWLTAPPSIDLELAPAGAKAVLRVRVRAVFASGTTWLIFPTTDGTGWVETRLEAKQDEE